MVDSTSNRNPYLEIHESFTIFLLQKLATEVPAKQRLVLLLRNRDKPGPETWTTVVSGKPAKAGRYRVSWNSRWSQTTILLLPAISIKIIKLNEP